MTQTYQDLALPNSTITRLIKCALPGNTSIKKNVKQIINQIAAVFVLYITYNANTQVQRAKRKVITAADILHALEVTGLGMFVPDLKEILDDRKEHLQRKKQNKIISKDTPKVEENKNEAYSDSILVESEENEELMEA